MSETPTSARVLGAVGRGLITAGIVVLLFVVYQLWGTNIQEARSQDNLRDEFSNTFAQAQSQLAVLEAGETDIEPDVLPAPVTSSTLPGGYTADVLRFFFPEDGDAVARIEIPSIGVDKIVVNGVQVADLRKGPGQYPSTAAPGTSGNTAVAGHRTTYGAPFNRIDELQPGDEIHVTGVLGGFTYRVMDPQTAFADQIETVDSLGAGHIIVRPSATWVLGDFGDNRVTLTACHPKLSSRQRIIVAAELVDAPAEAPEFEPETIAAFTGEDIDPQPTIPGEDIPGEDTPGEDIPGEDIPGEDTPGEDTPGEDTPGEDTPGEDAAADGEPPGSRQPTDEATADLDEGLNGERDAIPGAIAWMMGATAIWVLAGVIGRRQFEQRWQRVAVRFAALVPVSFFLWHSFEMIDRALPAG